MSMSDPLADMLTRIRNGQQARLASIVSPFSKLRANVLNVLKEEGYIADFEEGTDEKGFKQLSIKLQYNAGRPVIQKIQRVSKPGRRIYASVKNLPRFYNGLGIVVLSTPQGVISDFKARELNIGGEVLCKVF